VRKLLAVAAVVAALGGCGGGDPAGVPGAAADSIARPLAQAMQPLALVPSATDTAATAATAVRVYQAFFGGAPSNTELGSYRIQGSDQAARAMAAELAGMSNSTLASTVLSNLGISMSTVNATSYVVLLTAVEQIFAACGTSVRGQIVTNLVTILATLESDGVYGAAARAFNARIANNLAYANNTSNTTSTVPRSSSSANGGGGTSYVSAYTSCYNGTPAMYSSAYCEAYANAVVAGQSPAAANLAGATAANSNVGNIGMGQPISATGTPRPGSSTGGTTSGSTAPVSRSTAFGECYNGTPALYSYAYCSAYADAIAAGQSATSANLAGAVAANSNVGNVGTGQPLSSTGASRPGSGGGTSGGSTSGGSTSGGSTSGSSSSPNLAAAQACRNNDYSDSRADYQADVFSQLAGFDACLHRAGYTQYDEEGRTVCRQLDGLLRAMNSSWRSRYCPYPF
jgi:hypothetical protein